MGAIFRLFATDLGATQHHCFTMPEQLPKKINLPRTENTQFQWHIKIACEVLVTGG